MHLNRRMHECMSTDTIEMCSYFNLFVQICSISQNVFPKRKTIVSYSNLIIFSANTNYSPAPKEVGGGGVYCFTLVCPSHLNWGITS